jgi:hypothetical protein
MAGPAQWNLKTGLDGYGNEQAMYSYSAYGLGIRSAIPLPDLTANDVPADIVMRFGKATPISPIASDATFSLQFLEDRAFFFFRGLGSGEAVGGREIIGDPDAGMDEELMQFLAQGPALSVLLNQRGYLTLHASCIKIGDTAVAFMGDSGAGKSTMAAALHVRGHGLVSDELTVINNSGSEPQAYPGYPGLHLLPDVANQFRNQLEDLVRIGVHDRKVKVPAHSGFPRAPVSLVKIYLLSEGPHFQVSLLKGHKAVYELVKHSYWIRLVHDFRPSSYFLQCARLCARIPVMKLATPKVASALPEIAQMVERDVLSGIS